MDLFYQLPLVLQLLIKALLVVAVLMGLCLYGSLAERKEIGRASCRERV